MDNCQPILKEAVKIAEDAGVTICMEMLNSKVNHPGYMCDNYAWAFELCQRVNSPRFKMLFDIYHMQIMEGDLIATIKKNIQYIGHFHTAGVPGRHELDENQEIYYPAVMRAIVETGYQGYVAHEYTPRARRRSRRSCRPSRRVMCERRSSWKLKCEAWNVIARRSDEAISIPDGDCFASLAMTCSTWETSIRRTL